MTDGRTDTQTEVSKTYASQKHIYLRIGKDSLKISLVKIVVDSRLFCPEKGGNKFLRIHVTCLPNYTASVPIVQ